MFEEEKKRQTELIPRLEKIEVKFTGEPQEEATLIMNKHLSTPYDVARRKSDRTLEGGVCVRVCLS